MTGIQVISDLKQFQQKLSSIKSENLHVGFVPTMGALHEGHLSLVKTSVSQCDITIVSIFVNPTQFNDSKDLEQYPRTLESDLALLKDSGCQYVFTPKVEEIYAENYSPSTIDLGDLANVMEGAHRPGHFKGVMNVVERFFKIIEPYKAFFGRKDFQQVAVVRHMTQELGLPITIVECPTSRENSGLAMSSRNQRLSAEGKKKAAVLFESLELAKNRTTEFTPAEAMKECSGLFNAEVELEYFEIVHPTTLKSLTDQWVPGATACVVAKVEDVRLIDNLELIPTKEIVSAVE